MQETVVHPCIISEGFIHRTKISGKPSLLFVDQCRDTLNSGIILFLEIKPFKVTFTGALFFPGPEGKNEIIGMVRTYIGKTTPECLVSYGVLFTVLAFHFFRHGNFLLFFFS